MVSFYGLVLDQYNNDPGQWKVSASSPDPGTLRNLACYNDPPAPYSRAVWHSVSQEALAQAIPPCIGGDAAVVQAGTIHGFIHV
jgi:hypothetical protein